MPDYSIEEFKKSLAAFLDNLELCGLKNVNEKLYLELKSEIAKLNIDVMAYQENKRQITRDELTMRKVDIETLFDFHMQTGTASEIANFQIKEVTSNIIRVTSKLNKNNYPEILKEFQEVLKLYEDILTKTTNLSPIENIISKFFYQVYKFKISELIIPDIYDVNAFTIFALEDINTILNDPEVSSDIKNELRKYTVNSSLIMADFTKIIVYINYGLNNKKASKKEIEEELSHTYYEERYFKPEYIPLPSEEEKKIADMLKEYEGIKIDNYNQDGVKETFTGIVIYSLKNQNEKGAKDFISYLLNDNYPHVKYLTEAIINNDYFTIKELLKYPNYWPEIIKGIMAHITKIPFLELEDIAIKTSSEFLVRYILKNSKNLGRNFVEYAYYHNKDYFQKFLENCKDLIKDLFIDCIPKETQKDIINRYLNRSDIEEEKKYQKLFELYIYIENENAEIEKYILTKIINNPYVLNILSHVASYTIHKIIDLLSLSSIKNEILDYIIKEMDYTDYVDEYAKQCPEKFLQDTNIPRISILDAIYLSSYISRDNNILLFVKTHACKYLDWNHIISLLDSLFSRDRTEVLYYYYLNKPEEFKKRITERTERTASFLNSELASKIVAKNPEEIILFFDYLDSEAITNLSSESLDIFVKNYEAKLEEENITWEEKAQELRANSGQSSRQELITYVMYKGLINFNTMNLFIDFSLYYVINSEGEIKHFLPLILKAIKNAKNVYSRPALLLQLLTSNHKIDGDIDYSVIFSSKEELHNLKTDPSIPEEIRELQLRKYYGDLLKIMSKVSNANREKIVIEIAQSNIKEYVLFIKSNYPEYLDLLLTNISNAEIYKELIDFSDYMNIDDALRVSMLNNTKRGI